MVDEWEDSNGIHCHCEGVTLGGALLGEQCLSINMQLDILTIGVNEDSGKRGASTLDVPEGILAV